MNASSAYSMGIRLCVIAAAGSLGLGVCGLPPGMPTRAVAATTEASAAPDKTATASYQNSKGDGVIVFGSGATAKEPSWDIAAAIRKMEKTRVPPPGRRRCVVHVKAGLAAGGVQLDGGPVSAKDYGPVLEADGFQEIPGNAPLQAGDVVIIQSALRRPHGHMAMYNGRKWVSDFLQAGLYPGPHYRREKPEYKIYRRE
jgi:hypothetical protein